MIVISYNIELKLSYSIISNKQFEFLMQFHHSLCYFPTDTFDRVCFGYHVFMPLVTLQMTQGPC